MFLDLANQAAMTKSVGKKKIQEVPLLSFKSGGRDMGVHVDVRVTLSMYIYIQLSS